jgi:hypothetical protein
MNPEEPNKDMQERIAKEMREDPELRESLIAGAIKNGPPELLRALAEQYHKLGERETAEDLERMAVQREQGRKGLGDPGDA